MKFCFLIVFIVIIISCKEGNERKENINLKRQNLANLQWRDSVIDIGTVKLGKSYPLVYYVKNIGDRPLLFEKIESTCGCTVIDKIINKPILPNQIDSISAHFKMIAGTGYAERKIYILANTQQQFYILRVKANVVE